MWERFDKFADSWVLNAQRQCIAHNAARRDGDGTPELWVSKLRTEFALARGPSTTGSVLVLQRSSWVPVSAVNLPGVDPADALTIIGAFPEDRGGGAWATWWLTFLPGSGPADEWRFARAETQDRQGLRVPAAEIAGLLDALAQPTLPEAGYEQRHLQVPANPPNGYFDGFLNNTLRSFRRSAQEGVPIVQFIYGVALTREQQATEGLSWIAEAARRGYAPAQILLGIRLASGDGIARDCAAAGAWWWRAAAQGKDRARCILGDLALRGIGIERDAALAKACFEAAAANGSAAGQWRLAEMHKVWLAETPEQRAYSRHWARRAAQGGDPFALGALAMYDGKTAVPGDQPWPGEIRTRTASWLRGRISRASERREAEEALRTAETSDDVLARGHFSTGEAAIHVAMARSDYGLLWCNARDRFQWLQRRGIDLSPVLLELAAGKSWRPKVIALECLVPGETPEATIAAVLAATVDDRNPKVSGLARSIKARSARSASA